MRETMNTLKKIAAIVLLAVFVSLAATGCHSGHDHPSGDHPTREHPR